MPRGLMAPTRAFSVEGDSSTTKTTMVSCLTNCAKVEDICCVTWNLEIDLIKDLNRTSKKIIVSQDRLYDTLLDPIIIISLLQI